MTFTSFSVCSFCHCLCGILSAAGRETGSKYGDGGGDPLAVSPTSPSAGPKSESMLGAERHHAAAKALTNTKVPTTTAVFFDCLWSHHPHAYLYAPGDEAN